MQVYKKVGNKYQYIFSIKPFYTQLLEYKNHHRNIREKEIKRQQELQREKDEREEYLQRMRNKRRVKLIWNIKGYDFNYATHEITKMDIIQHCRFMKRCNSGGLPEMEQELLKSIRLD